MRVSRFLMLGLLLTVTAVHANEQRQPVQKKKGMVDQASGQGFGMAGCGLGSMLFGEKPGLIQVVAATFNSTAGNQTFAITSGTSNCESDDSGARAELFIQNNRVALESDVSRGNGEALASLGEILGCSTTAPLGANLQRNFQQIFPSRSTSPGSVVKSIHETIRQNSQLSQQCQFVG